MDRVKKILHHPSFGGILLLTASLVAILIYNSRYHDPFTAALHATIPFEIGPIALSKSLSHWINDGLMVFFFLLVGLEIKREMLRGVLSSTAKIILPALGAVGGLILPAIIYACFNRHDATALRGWAIPSATDIAFSLGVLSLLGSRIPVSLKVFLSALAILDDIAAIIIIAVFYTDSLSMLYLSLAGAAVLALFILNYFHVKHLSPYGFIGLLLWFFVLKSGVHATLTGIAVAFAIPMESPDDPEHSPLMILETHLHPWVTYFIVPIFALANAGISFADLTTSDFLHSIPLGIGIGLFLGKQLGIFSTCWLLIKLGIARLPDEITWSQLYGVSIICGIGFTMSLFIGNLAFPGFTNNYGHLVRLGVIIGSLCSGLVGSLVLMKCKPKAESQSY